jgi:hypothetical protein
MKISAVGAELFHEEGRTDMAKLTVACRNFQSMAVYGCNVMGDTFRLATVQYHLCEIYKVGH